MIESVKDEREQQQQRSKDLIEQKGTLLLDVGLKKKWASGPSYWIRLYEVKMTIKKKRSAFIIERSWRFSREGEPVQGSVYSDIETDAIEILDEMGHLLERQTGEKEYLIRHINAHDKEYDLEEIVHEAIDDFMLRACSKQKEQIEVRETVTKKEDLLNKFKQKAQSRREKSQW